MKRLFSFHQRLRPETFANIEVGPSSLTNICAALGREPQGRLHCGLDDARSVAEICLAWLSDEMLARELFAVSNLEDPQARLVQAEAAAEAGNEEQLCVGVHLTSVPYVVHGRLMEVWLAGILDGRYGLDANEARPSSVHLAPTELWLIVNSNGLPCGSAVALFPPPLALSCARTLRYGREFHVVCYEVENNKDEVFYVRSVRGAPVTAKELASLAERAIVFPPTAEHIDAVRFDELVIHYNDWFCPSCDEFNRADSLVCTNCSFPLTPAQKLVSLRLKSSQAAK